MTTVTAPSRMSLRTPEDVLAATPYLLGFHPVDSLVVLGLTGKKLTFHVRGDLPPAGSSRPLLDDLADYFGDLFLRQGVDGVVLVGYGTGQSGTPLITAVRHAMRRRRVEVRDMPPATDGPHWPYLCSNPR